MMMTIPSSILWGIGRHWHDDDHSFFNLAGVLVIMGYMMTISTSIFRSFGHHKY